MTFIASVIAKKGVAIIADSLVTSSPLILHYSRFLDHLEKQKPNAAGEISLNAAEIESLFGQEPIYTKDYEEKLFKLNKYTAITTTGIAEINKKKIIDIVHEFAVSRSDIENLSIPITDKIKQFSDFVINEVKQHIAENSYIGSCIFIVTFYDHLLATAHIYRIVVLEADKRALETEHYPFLRIRKEENWIKVVCDGQNKLSDNVLYGIGKLFWDIFGDVVRNILDKLDLPNGAIPLDFVETLQEDPYFKNIFYGDVALLNLTDLSLQQAVDLASLLMRLEVDFQKYTRNVPTVGGLIKLAIIDENGFKFISGNEVQPPRHIVL